MAVQRSIEVSQLSNAPMQGGCGQGLFFRALQDTVSQYRLDA